jgi:predicted enzyme related to lactoylglutathione lyase
MSTSESTSTQTAQSTHQQPAIGSPAWIRIPASNVPRAQKFYQEVFGWKFHDHSKEGYAVNKLAVFTIPGAPTLMVS